MLSESMLSDMLSESTSLLSGGGSSSPASTELGAALSGITLSGSCPPSASTLSGAGSVGATAIPRSETSARSWRPRRLTPAMRRNEPRPSPDGEDSWPSSVDGGPSLRT